LILDKLSWRGRQTEQNHWVQDWLSARAEAPKTKLGYEQGLAIFVEFCRARGKDFLKVVEEWRAARIAGVQAQDVFTDEWTDIVRSFSAHIKPDYAPLTVKNRLVAVKSFLHYWRVAVDVELPKRACVIYHNRDLTREEVRQVLTHASPRDRVIWLVMVEAGMRGQTAVDLKYWQIKEDFEKGVTPMRIMLPAAALKDHVGDRWTFIGEDGAGELKEYLKPRLPLKDDDYVFASERQGRVKGEQFSAASLSVKFNRVTHKLRMDQSRDGKPKSVRMHGLRKYFRNNMKAEEAYREFWMGHSLGVDAHYITRDPEVHRREYARGYEHLRIFEPSIDSLAELRQDLLQKLQKKDQEMDQLRKQNEDLADEVETIRRYLRKMPKADVARLVVRMTEDLGQDKDESK
jgi:hypothetical protein